MSRYGGTHLYTCPIALAGLVYVLNASSSPLRAQSPETPNVSFEERFLLDHKAGPTFTRPEVQQLLSSLQPSVTPEDSTGSTEATPGEPHPRQQIAFSAPKGPAKVFKEFLRMPAKELLVSRAEAEPQVPGSSTPREAAPQPERSPDIHTEQPGQQMALVPGRAAEPLVERPPPEAAVSAPGRIDRPDERAPEQDRGAAPQVHTPAPALTQHDQPAVQEGTAGSAPVQSSMDATRPQEPGPAPVAKEAKLATEQANRDGGERGQPRSLRNPEPAATADRPAPRRIGTGRATWYQHPGRTASGEPFNPNRLTAAHRTLPFGTRVRVVHELTRRSVDVRINDRIPRTAKAVIDLSRASAKAIGLTGAARVSLYQL